MALQSDTDSLIGTYSNRHPQIKIDRSAFVGIRIVPLCVMSLALRLHKKQQHVHLSHIMIFFVGDSFETSLKVENNGSVSFMLDCSMAAAPLCHGFSSACRTGSYIREDMGQSSQFLLQRVEVNTRWTETWTSRRRRMA